MISFIDSAYAEFLYKEQRHKDIKTPETEKEYGVAKLNLHMAIKKTSEALRYYQQGFNDGGREAHQALYPNTVHEPKCKSC